MEEQEVLGSHRPNSEVAGAVPGTRPALLPFSLYSFRAAVEDGERRREGQERKAMWTVPGEKPLAEPLYFSWDWLEKHWPSDLRFQKLFPGDPEKQGRMKDIEAEYQALNAYRNRVQRDILSALGLQDPRRGFFSSLLEDLTLDFNAVLNERNALLDSAGDLGRWEFNCLLQDGSFPEGIIAWLYQDKAPPNWWKPQVQAKYGHLNPTPLQKFEFNYVDHNYINGKKVFLMDHIKLGGTIRWHDDKDVQAKYKHVLEKLESEGYVGEYVTEGKGDKRYSMRKK